MEDRVLAHQIVAREGATPDKAMLVLHGILGMGRNFHSIAKSLSEAAPSWCFVLCDLRGHGQSLGLAGPHTLAAAADDLRRVAARLAVPVRGVMGHSFGGKVALQLVASMPVDVACVLDSNPGPRPSGAGEGDGVSEVVTALLELPPTFPSREAFQEAMRARGFPRAIVEWLSMSVRRAGEAYALTIELATVRALLADYFAQDLFGVVEDPTRARRLAFVSGGRSHVFDPSARARLDAAAARNPHLSITELPAAGHWIHVDDPHGTLEAIRAAIL